MRYILGILSLLLCSGLFAQPMLRTVVPSRPLVEGEAFTIQYVWEDEEKLSNFRGPNFQGLKLINGPISYKGAVPGPNGIIQVQNFIFTVLAPVKGIFKLPAATGSWKGKNIESDVAILRVITAKEAQVNAQKEQRDPGSFLKPGEDPDKKMKENLFLRVTVDRNETYIGQPIVATYKLYSRLESRSEIVKNPGFYGFSVYDMVNLQDKATGTETVNGLSFDVHVIRQVQLYPMQVGELFVDPVEVHNRVIFSKQPGTRKTSQEIAEGMLGGNDYNPGYGEAYENQISSEPIKIMVKPIGENERPPNFDGAVGDFSIRAELKKNKLARNEGGVLEITISGTGNLIQLAPPSIQWPGGIEGFEAKVIDSFDKNQAPLKGNRMFRYSFVSAKSGDYVLPAIEFQFFDPATKSFRTDSTKILRFKIEDRDNRAQLPLVSKEPGSKLKKSWWILPLLLAGLIFLILRIRKGMKDQIEVAPPAARKNIEKLLMPGRDLINAEGVGFYFFMRQSLWQYFSERLGLSGSEMNRRKLEQALSKQKLETSLIKELLGILDQCELAIFTNTAGLQKKKLFYRAIELLNKTEDSIYSAYL